MNKVFHFFREKKIFQFFLGQKTNKVFHLLVLLADNSGCIPAQQESTDPPSLWLVQASRIWVGLCKVQMRSG